MHQLTPIHYENQRILTTQQLAESYETESQVITNNFNRNKERYVEGKHFHCLDGSELKDFKATTQIDLLQNINKLYLWTEKGALLHAKSLNTDVAWQVYDELVENYFRKSEETLSFPIPKTLPEALRLAAALAERNDTLCLEVAQKEQIINELQPKAGYYDLILQSKTLLSVSKIAKDFGLTAQRLNQILHEERVQYNQSGVWLLYKEFASKGYTQSKTHVIDGEKSSLHTYWTQKGRLFIYDLLKNKRGVLPLIERPEVSA